MHIACQRRDDHDNADAVVRLLLTAGADANLIANGQTALTLAIASGNDAAIRTLFEFHAADAGLR